jgi:ankyrin repeat protein
MRTRYSIAADIDSNVTNKAIDALFILAQHDGCKWAYEFRHVKDLCRASRAETGLWRVLVRLRYGREKNTLLMYESYRGRSERVQWLLARGADVNIANIHGTTSLFLAANARWSQADEIGRIETVRALIAAGADVNVRRVGAPFFGLFLPRGETPLSAASAQGNVPIVHELIAAGADVNRATSIGATPLFNASQFGHLYIVRALIAAGADVNRAINVGGATPLSIASQLEHVAIIQALVEAGGIM